MPEQPQISSEQPKTGLLNNLRTVFLVTAVMPFINFAMRGPATNSKQLIFRISMTIVGVVGLVVVQILLWRAQRENSGS